MAKKKKTNPFQALKLAKAQHHNDYLRKLEYWCNTICGEKVFKHLPNAYVEFIYKCRCRSFKIEVAEGHTVKKEVLKDCEVLVINQLEKEEHCLSEELPMISFADYYTIGISLSFIPNDIKRGAKTFGSDIDAILMKLEIIDEKFMDIGLELDTTLCVFGYQSSEIGKPLYWLSFDIKKKIETDPFLHNIIRIQSHILETDSINIDGNQRPIIRVGWTFANFGIDYSSIKPIALGIKSQFAEIPMDVYIQSHALMRLSERIDSFNTDVLHLNIYISLKNPVFCYDINKRILIEYRFFDVKVGYFRADIIDGKIVLRTFLFILNNGTPESQKLEQNTGLQKFDIEYLVIHKLSSFMNSDINKNEAVKKIFIDADCQCLLELYDNMKTLLKKTTDTFDSKHLLEYLKFKDVEEMLTEAELDLNLKEMLV